MADDDTQRGSTDDVSEAPTTGVEEMSLDELREEGVIEHVGVSNFEPHHVETAQDAIDAPISAVFGDDWEFISDNIPDVTDRMVFAVANVAVGGVAFGYAAAVATSATIVVRVGTWWCWTDPFEVKDAQLQDVIECGTLRPGHHLHAADAGLCLQVQRYVAIEGGAQFFTPSVKFREVSR